jgi:peptide-methionine (S)-S-oxide reductase
MKRVLIALSTVVLSFILSAMPAQAPSIAANTDSTTYKTATFAGGCFWCMEQPFDAIDGVISTIAGYTGGSKVNPTYREVSAGNTGHTESVQVTYDPQKVEYAKLVETFWHNIDPLDAKGQFCDKGSQYRSEIFYADDQQKAIATKAKSELTKSGQLDGPIATAITAASQFYPAEDYHQNFYQTNTLKYKVYRFGCGRDQRLEKIWGKAAAH